VLHIFHHYSVKPFQVSGGGGSPCLVIAAAEAKKKELEAQLAKEAGLKEDENI
jgi:hypothetical protein